MRKIFTLRSLKLILLSFAVHINSYAQTECNSPNSPIKGTPLLGQASTLIIWNSPDCNASEGMVSSTMLNRSFQYQQLDDVFDRVNIIFPDDTAQGAPTSSNKADGVRLRLSYSEKDAFVIVTGDMHIRTAYIDRIVKLDSVWTAKDTTIQIPNATLVNGITLTAGDFDGDGGDEFAVAYETSSNEMRIGIFKLDDNLVPDLQDTLLVSDGELYPCGVTANDFDADGKDELIILWKKSTVDNIYLQAADVDDDLHLIAEEPVLVLHPTIENVFEEMSLTSGDYDGDGHPELAFGYTIVSPCNEGEDNNCEDVFVYPLKLTDDAATTTVDPMEKFVLNTDQVIKYYLFSADGDQAPSKMELLSGDLNGDSTDELIIGAHEVHVISLSTNLDVAKDINETTMSEYKANKFLRPVSIGDINGDKVDDLIVVNYIPGQVGDISYFEVRCAGYDQDFVHNFYESSMTDSVDSPCDRNYSVLTGFFSGSYFRIDSCGTHKIRQDIQDPVIILNSPPVHFDVLDGDTYDLNKVFLEENEDYYIEYGSETENTEATFITTTTSGDWGFQPDVSFGGEASYKDLIGASFSLGLGADESASEQLYSNSSVTETVSSRTRQSSKDDAVLALVTNYETWEHYVYDEHDKIIGKIIAVKQESPHYQWTETRSALNKGLYLQHEFGNILSYPYYANPTVDNPQVKTFIGTGTTKAIQLGVALQTEQKLTWSKYLTEEETKQYNKSEKPSGFGISLFGIFDIGVEDGSLAQEETISTAQHTLGTQTEILLQVGVVESSERSFSVMPYFYWSKSGALVVDYVVKPDVLTGTWWTSHYGQKPDPAFIMPFRLDNAKGIPAYDDETLYNQTSSIFFNPTIPDEADTITIYAKINNYSLISTGEPIPVSFYANDPANPSNLIKNANGESVFYTTGSIDQRSYSFVSMRWAIPDNLRNSNTKIYAVIDPDNTMDEIHKDNNIGWSYLFKFRNTANPTSINDRVSYNKKGLALQIYPNPVSDISEIHYTLHKPSDTRIELISGNGQLINIIADERNQQTGEHSVTLNLDGFPAGLYFVHIVSGSWQDVVKLVKR